MVWYIEVILVRVWAVSDVVAQVIKKNILLPHTLILWMLLNPTDEPMLLRSILARLNCGCGRMEKRSRGSRLLTV
jgi:hypothetical protein